jgi:hypothetical protein
LDAARERAATATAARFAELPNVEALMRKPRALHAEPQAAVMQPRKRVERTKSFVRRFSVSGYVRLHQSRCVTRPAQKHARQDMKLIPQHRIAQTTMAAAAMVLAFAPRWAAAQAYTEPTYTTQTEVPPVPEHREHAKGLGIAVSAAGGVSSFTRSSTRDVTDTGGTWDVRGVFGTRSPFALEAAYVGAAYGLDVLNRSSTLLGNGAEVSGRFNIFRNGFTKRPGLQPYVLGGVAWMHYNVTTDFSTASIDDNDNTFEVPVAAGLSYYFKNGMLLDVRGAYRFAFSDTIIQGSSLDSVNVTARLGAEF